MSYEEMDDWIDGERALGRKVGFTCGCFDLLHAGHVHYLQAAKELCDRLIVAVNSDASVERYKSPLRPITPQEQRMYVIAGLQAVDAVTLLEEDRPLSILLRWKPDVYIKGGDYSTSALQSGAAVRDYGGAVVVIEPRFQTSTSQILERVQLLATHAAPLSSGNGRPAGLLLLDRDGTLIRDIPFLHDPNEVVLLPEVGEGLRQLQESGFQFAIVTNQQGVGLGYYSTQDFISVNQQLFRKLSAYGILISRVYFCPHSAADGCTCRKPAGGLLRRALTDFGISPDHAFFVGDSEVDTEAGAAVGCRTVYLGTKPDVVCTYRASGFGDATRWLLGNIPAAE